MFVIDKKAQKVLDKLLEEADDDVRCKIQKITKKPDLYTKDFNEIKYLLPSSSEFYKFALLIKPKEVKEERPKPSKEYLERIEKLKLAQERRDYNEMIKSVDAQQGYGKENLMQDFGKELRESNRQVIAVFNMLITVGGAFVFGFYGISFAYPALRLDLASRMIIGMVCATIVFFADLYFIAKTMEVETYKEEQERKRREKTYTLDTKTIVRSLKDDVKGSQYKGDDEKVETIHKESKEASETKKTPQKLAKKRKKAKKVD